MSAPFRRAWSRALLVATALLVPAAVRAQSNNSACATTGPIRVDAPSIGILINGVCTDLSSSVRRSGTQDLQWRAEVDQVIGGARIQLDATFKFDPFINFTFASTLGIGTPISIAAFFSTPVAALPYNSAASTGGVTVTSRQGATAVVSPSAFYPSFISGTGVNGAVNTNLGVDIGSGTCIATGAMPTQTCPYGPGASSFAPTLYNGLRTLLTYQHVGDGSTAAWTGRVDLLDTPRSTVPEPATVLLVGIGLAATGLVARGRREG